jgi:hypothetical protein
LRKVDMAAHDCCRPDYFRPVRYAATIKATM